MVGGVRIWVVGVVRTDTLADVVGGVRIWVVGVVGVVRTDPSWCSGWSQNIPYPLQQTELQELESVQSQVTSSTSAAHYHKMEVGKEVKENESDGDIEEIIFLDWRSRYTCV